ARLGSPHPLALSECPLSIFLARVKPPAAVERWHAQQHDARATQPGAGRLLVNWFVHEIHDSGGAAGMRSGSAAP
ncbi:hypothetical protein, partial [Arthrobacter sp. Br18]|uniref:hypothetical protein n=1 Tax=Arthrobacter sp. Br18 TaxID=1312954 RepID=UPI00138AC181